ncbi:MAG: deoxynucleoside kinase [Oscillospiraceae bacterium]|nr:deoxynucleoside kinase [Oscillospiraceae bacterium]
MGRLIVFEGTDGSGKSTQLELLRQRLTADGTDFRTLTFPCYDKESSALVRMYLRGDFGSRPEDVNAYAASSFFSVDRYASFKQDWEADWQADRLILADRYTTSNAVHQAAKLPPEEWEHYLNWLFHYEYDLLGLPRPTCVLWLDMPVEHTLRLMRQRPGAPDIHEQDAAYLHRCHDAAALAAELGHWRRIPCADERGPLSPEAVHSAVREVLTGLCL